jgi:hypothetical protein
MVTDLTFFPKSPEELAGLKHIEPAELKTKFDAPAVKGVIYRTVTRGTKIALKKG